MHLATRCVHATRLLCLAGSATLSWRIWFYTPRTVEPFQALNRDAQVLAKNPMVDNLEMESLVDQTGGLHTLHIEEVFTTLGLKDKDKVRRAHASIAQHKSRGTDQHIDQGRM